MNLVAAYKLVLKDIEELKGRISKLEVPVPVKRGPGRPRKNPEVPKVPKKRGRPRKT